MMQFIDINKLDKFKALFSTTDASCKIKYSNKHCYNNAGFTFDALEDKTQQMVQLLGMLHDRLMDFYSSWTLLSETIRASVLLHAVFLKIGATK